MVENAKKKKKAGHRRGLVAEEPEGEIQYRSNELDPSNTSTVHA
jgi:hypothetical protein